MKFLNIATYLATSLIFSALPLVEKEKLEKYNCSNCRLLYYIDPIGCELYCVRDDGVCEEHLSKVA